MNLSKEELFMRSEAARARFVASFEAMSYLESAIRAFESEAIDHRALCREDVIIWSNRLGSVRDSLALFRRQMEVELDEHRYRWQLARQGETAPEWLREIVAKYGPAVPSPPSSDDVPDDSSPDVFDPLRKSVPPTG